jgi:hypothetical protein
VFVEPRSAGMRCAHVNNGPRWTDRDVAKCKAPAYYRDQNSAMRDGTRERENVVSKDAL